MAKVNWFPVARTLIEDEQFQQLPAVYKVFYFDLCSHYNLAGKSFYKADIYFATKYRVSADTIRRARKKLLDMKLIRYKPGGLKRDRKIATTYDWIRYAKAEECLWQGRDNPKPIVKFTKLHRFTFEVLLLNVRHGKLQIEDIITYIVLVFWRDTRHLMWSDTAAADRLREQIEYRDNANFEDKYFNNFFISKRDLTRYVGKSLFKAGLAVELVERLQKAIVFGNGKQLFEYAEERHKLVFWDWRSFADPSENETNASIEDTMRQELEDEVAAAKETL